MKVDDEIYEIDYYNHDLDGALRILNERLGAGNWKRIETVPLTDLINTLKFNVTNPDVSHLTHLCKNWITFGIIR